MYKFNGCKNVVPENNSYDSGMNLKAEIQNMDASENQAQRGSYCHQRRRKYSRDSGDIYYVSSSDENILKVSDTGIVTAVGEGTASIRTFAVSGGRKYEEAH